MANDPKQLKHITYRQFPFQKTIAFFLLISFTLLNTSLNLFAEILPVSLTGHVNLVVNPSQILDSLKLPEELGNIQESFIPQDGAKDQLVVYVQDAHANVDSETSLRKIIQFFQKKYQLPLVLLEGGEGKLDSLFFKSFPDQTVKEKILNEYLKNGDLQGGEVASILSDEHDTNYYGMENQALYEENKRVFLEATGKEKEILEKLNQSDIDLNEKAKIVLLPKSLAFKEQSKAFHNESIQLMEYLKSLATLLGNSETIKANYPELQKILISEQNEKTYQGADYDMAMNQLISQFKSQILHGLSKEQKLETGEMIQNYQTGKLDRGFLVKRIQELSNGSISIPEVLQPTAKHAETLSSIKGTKLFDELEQLEDYLRETLPQSEEEKKMLQDYKQLELLKSFAKLEITHKDWQALKDQKVTIDSDFETHFKFYELALQRDEALFRNTLKIMEKQKSKLALISTGGFHQEGIKAKLKDQNISFILISPKINQIGTKDNYMNAMQEKRSFMKYYKGSLWDALAQDYATKLAATLNEQELTPSLKRWRDRIIQNSIAEGRITQATSYTKYVDALVQALRSEYNKTSPFNQEAELRKNLERELESFHSTYFGKLKSRVDQKLNIFTEGLKSMWEKKDFSQIAIQGLVNQMNAIPKSNIAVALALVNDKLSTAERLGAIKSILKTVPTREERKAVVDLAREFVQQVKDGKMSIDDLNMQFTAETVGIGNNPAGEVLARSEVRNPDDRRHILETAISQIQSNEPVSSSPKFRTELRANPIDSNAVDRDLDRTLKTFENTHELLEVLNQLASGRPNESEQGRTFKRERKDALRIRYTLMAMAELSAQISNKKQISEKIIEEFTRADQSIQPTLLYDLSHALGRAVSDADEETKKGVTRYLQEEILPRVLKDNEKRRQNRNLTAVANALVSIYIKADEQVQTEIFRLIQDQIMAVIDLRVESAKTGLGNQDVAKFLNGAQQPSIKQKRTLEELKDLLMTKASVLQTMGWLYSNSTSEDLKRRAAIIYDQFFSQVESLDYEAAIAAAFQGLSGAYLALHLNAPLAAREQAWETVRVRAISSLNALQDVQAKSRVLASLYEKAATLFEKVPQDSALRILEMIQTQIIAPILSIESEEYRSIALSRIAISLANLSKRQGAAFQRKVKDYLQQGLRVAIETRGQIGYITDSASRFEGISKIERAAASIYLQTESTEDRREAIDKFISSQEPLWREFAGRNGPLSRLLSGNVHTLAEFSQNGSVQDRQHVLQVVEKRILPQIFEMNESRALFRGAVRVVAAIALLYKHAPQEEKLAAVAFIRERILENALKAAKGETFYLENLINFYQSLHVLTTEEPDQPADLESLSPDRTAAFVGQLNSQRRKRFFIYLGNYASKKSLLEHLSYLDFSAEDKMAMLYGHLIFERIFPPFNAPISIYQVMDSEKTTQMVEKISRNEISKQDLYDLSSYIGIDLSLKGWHDIAMNLDFIANDPMAHLILIRNIIVTARLKSEQGEPWLKAVDIEKIPLLVRESLEKIFSDAETAALAYPDLRLLLRSIPLDSALINAVRNIINQWYQNAYQKRQRPGVSLEELKRSDKKEVDSFMTTIRVKLHDSPSPYHLKIVRAYVDYLKSSKEDEKAALTALNRVLDPFKVTVPEDYAQRMRQRDDYNQILSDSEQMLELFDELYGAQQARGLMRVLQDAQWKGKMTRDSYGRIIDFLTAIRNSYKLPRYAIRNQNKMSREALLDQIIRKGDVDFYEASTLENFTLQYRVELLRMLAQIYSDLGKQINLDPTNGAKRLYLMRVLNMIEPFVFSLISGFRESWVAMEPAMQKKVLELSLQLQAETMAEGQGKKTISNIIQNLQTIDLRNQPLRYFQQVLLQAERELVLLADEVSVLHQKRAEHYAAQAGFSDKNVEDFSANMIRESVLFTTSLLVSSAADQYADQHNLPRWHVTRAGTAQGKLLWVDNLKTFTEELPSDTILVTESIPDDIAMPRVAAILTRQVEDSLSHLAIMAGYYGIPWGSVSPKNLKD